MQTRMPMAILMRMLMLVPKRMPVAMLIAKAVRIRMLIFVHVSALCARCIGHMGEP